MDELRIKGLRRVFGNRRKSVVAVDDVDVSVGKGELLVLLGPSGCGKTTILRCIAGLEHPDGGSIALRDKPVFDAARGLNVRPNRRNIGMVFQSFALWPHMTVEKNVSYPLRARRDMQALRSGRVQEILEAVHCGELADRLPSQLSGGQQQRVALARSLVSRPNIMLFDEPLSSLDALLRTRLRKDLRQMHRSLGYCGVYVTHDQREAFELGDRIAVMRAGRIEQIGEPESVHQRPATRYAAEFLGMSNRIPLTIQDDRWTTDVGRLLIGDIKREYRAAASSAEIRCRQGDILLLAPGAHLAGMGGVAAVLCGGIVVDVAFVGTHVEYTLKVGSLGLVAQDESRGPRWAKGDSVDLALLGASTMVYGAEDLLGSLEDVVTQRATQGAGR